MDIPNASSLPEAAKKGHLQKLASRSFPYIQHQWKRKYCILVGGHLYFYDRDDAKGSDKGSGVVNLEYFDQVVEAGAKEAKKANHAFVVTSQDRTFFDPGRHLFSADTAASMTEWMRYIQKAIEQIRNNNKTRAGGAVAAALNQANSAANNRSAAGTKPPPKPTEVPRDKKIGGPEADKAKKRLSGADADKGVENKENNKENNKDWAAPEERKAKPSDSSLRRRKPGAGGRTNEDEAADTDSAKNFYSLGRKKPDALPTPTGSLGRKTNPKTTKPATAASEETSKMGGKSKEIGKKRKADDEGLEEGDVAMEVPEAAGQLESVTKNRVKGPAGRRMPQHRRTHFMKHRASSLSALAHTAADASNADNHTNRSALMLPSHRPSSGPRSTSADDERSRLSASLPDDQRRSSCSSGRLLDCKAGVTAVQNGADKLIHEIIKGEDLITKESTKDVGIDDVESHAQIQTEASGEDDSELSGGGHVTNGCALTEGIDARKVTTHPDTGVEPEENGTDVAESSVAKIDDEITASFNRGCEENGDACPTKITYSDCLACKICAQCQLKVGCCKYKGNDDAEGNFIEAEANSPSSLDEAKCDQVDEGTKSLEEGTEVNKCRSCSEVLKSEHETIAPNPPVPKTDTQASVSLRPKAVQDDVKSACSEGTFRPSAQIETVEMDTFDDIDDALFFRPPTMYGSPDENGNEGGKLKAKKEKPLKLKTKKRVTLTDNSPGKTLTSRAPSDAKSRISRFRKTLTSFRRERLKSDGNLVDSHPDECGSTRRSFCAIL